MNSRIRMPLGLPVCLALVLSVISQGQESARPVKVVINDGKLLAADVPVDPTPRIQSASQGMLFGLMVGPTRITCTPNGSVYPLVRIDNKIITQPGADLATGQVTMLEPLPPGRSGKKRLGTRTKWVVNNQLITQVIELVPSRLPSDAQPGQKRKLDTVRVSIEIENQDARDHQLEFRAFVDAMIADNDGALFAAPTTAPGEILDGVLLEGPKLPEYLQVLERPDLQSPGFVGVMTLRFTGKAEGPSRVVLANTKLLGALWDVPPQKAGGDSAVFLFWGPKSLKRGEKRALVWAYGAGIACDPEPDDNIALSLGGSFEPGKLFSVLVTVDDPVPGQALTLELPPGMERVEGNERQPVPDPQAGGTSAVLWKARVTQLGDFALKVRSSTGVTHVKNISVQAAKSPWK
jgi:hypothetical protein